MTGRKSSGAELARRAGRVNDGFSRDCSCEIPRKLCGWQAYALGMRALVLLAALLSLTGIFYYVFF